MLQLLSGFYGTEIETWYVGTIGRTWLVQSPEMGKGHLAVSSAGPADEAALLSLSVLDQDLIALADSLDALPRSCGGVITRRELNAEEKP